jgi:hypothetical protein
MSKSARRAMNELRDEVRSLAHRSVDMQCVAPCVAAPGLCCAHQHASWRTTASAPGIRGKCLHTGAARALLLRKPGAHSELRQKPKVRLRTSAAAGHRVLLR